MKALDVFASAWPACWLCESPRELQIHHICGRRGSQPHDPRNLFRACRTCHALYHDGSKTQRHIALEHILYAKRYFDAANYDPSYLASLRGKKHLGVEPMVPDWWPYDVGFKLLERPVPQPRARITRRGPPRAYVPSDHAVHGFRAAVANAARANGACATARPVDLSVIAVFKRPESHWRKGVLKVTAPLLPRPDVDNVAKSVMDALIGVAYQDDTLVMSLRAQKQYGTEDYVIVRVQHAE